MAECGIARIDQLLAGGGTPLAPGDPDHEAVGALQDLLRCQGQHLPSPFDAGHGLFGPQTESAVRAVCRSCGIAPTGTVDGSALSAFITKEASTPVAARPYLTLVLDLAWDQLTNVLCLTAVAEGNGRFGAVNRNTDGAGLSFGIIQWAQKPGRLAELLQALRTADAAAFDAVFGGPAVVALARDMTNDLTTADWVARFEKAALSQAFQKVQVAEALSAFRAFRAELALFAPELASERAVAFMLDLANQFGPTGAKNLYLLKRTLPAIADESVRRMAANLQAGVRARRDLFLNTPLLSDTATLPA